MKYRAWARAGTALLLTVVPNLSAFAQPAVSTTTTSTSTTPPNVVPILNPASQTALQRAISSGQRIEPARDRWRNPGATLQFFGVRPTDTVIEIWPGQGWYTSILGPYLKQGSGSLIVGHFDASSTSSSFVRQIVDAYRGRFASDVGTYGNVNVVPFGPRSGPLAPPGTADSVLTFRNVHNWMKQGWAEKAFGDFFLALKPGGILGIEEHRGRTDEPQDPLAIDGYVREDYVIQLAREAGFEFIGRSEINANPADTKDHPFGVWTLPPVSRSSPSGDRDDPGFDRTRYDAIGESDRMTLRFRKPLNGTGAPPPPGTRWSPVIVAPAPAIVTPPTSVTARAVTPAGRLPVPVPRVIAPTPVVPTAATAAPVVVPGRAGTPTVAVNPVRAPATLNSEATAPRAATPSPKPASTSATATLSPAAPSASVVTTPTPPSTPAPTANVTPTQTETVVGPTDAPKTIGSEPIVAPVVIPQTASATPTQAPSQVPALVKPAVVTPSGEPAAVSSTISPPARAPSTTSTPAATPAAVATGTARATRNAAPRRPPRAVASTARAATPVITPNVPTVRPARPASPASPPAIAAAPKAKAKTVSPATLRPAAGTSSRPTAKAPTRPAAQPATRPPVAAPKAKAKAAPPPTVDPNKPDWVVPRRRS